MLHQTHLTTVRGLSWHSAFPLTLSRFLTTELMIRKFPLAKSGLLRWQTPCTFTYANYPCEVLSVGALVCETKRSNPTSTACDDMNSSSQRVWIPASVSNPLPNHCWKAPRGALRRIAWLLQISSTDLLKLRERACISTGPSQNFARSHRLCISLRGWRGSRPLFVRAKMLQ